MSSFYYGGSVRMNPENNEFVHVNEEEIPYTVPKFYFDVCGEDYYPQLDFSWDEETIVAIRGKRVVKYTSSSFTELLAKNEEGEVVWMDGRTAPYSGCWKGEYLDDTRQADEYVITEYDLETNKKQMYKVVLEAEMDVVDSDLSWLSSVVGSGFEIKDGVLLRYDGWNEDIVIPEGVKEISSGSLWCDHSLNSIKIPNTVEKISFDDFPRCQFKNIEIAEDNPRYVSKEGFVIDKETQTLMWAHTGTIIPNDGSVRKIASNAFYGRIDIHEIVIPDTILEIDDHIFGRDNHLQCVEVPDSFNNDIERIFNVPSECVEEVK